MLYVNSALLDFLFEAKDDRIAQWVFAHRDKLTTKIGNYLSVDVKLGQLSYLPSKYCVQGRDFLDKEGRVTGKAPRIMKKFFPEPTDGVDPKEMFTEAEWDVFGTLIASFKGEFQRIHVVRGEDIRFWYNEANYSATSGANTSCMRHARSATFFDIYVNNPNQIGLCIVLDKDRKLDGRAILWTDDKGQLVLDRAYMKTQDFALVQRWLAEQGGTTVNHWRGTITLETTKGRDKLPYFDSMAFKSSTSNVLTRR